MADFAGFWLWLKNNATQLSVIVAIVCAGVTIFMYYQSYKQGEANKKIAQKALDVSSESNEIASEANKIAKEVSDRLETEKVLLQFQGGVTCYEYQTRFDTISTMTGTKRIITTYWPVTISNVGHNTVSFVAYDAVSRIHGKKRNIETKLLDLEGNSSLSPINMKKGESQTYLLVVPIHILKSVYELVSDVKMFSDSFTPKELDEYLKENHGIDFYGNKYRYAEKYAGVGKNRVAVHVFGFNKDGVLRDTSMQADQITIEFKTARDNFFSARALYYETPTFKPQPVKYLEKGKPATTQLELESVDSLSE